MERLCLPVDAGELWLPEQPAGNPRGFAAASPGARPRKEFPTIIAADGIAVDALRSDEFRSAGPIERASGIDTVLHGGYFCSSSMLITGAPGVAKSILAGALGLMETMAYDNRTFADG